MSKRKDKMTPKQRSYCMSQVKGKNTEIEIIVGSALRQRGLRFTKHVASLPGKPDIVFVKAQVAVFVDGNFWHGYRFNSWKRKMKTFWKKKILGNMERDRRNFRKLRRNGWKVVRIWEQAARRDLNKQVLRVETAVRSSPSR